MGDPFSIATGVAGLVSLGITVCDGLHTYFSAIKDRKDDLAIVTQNVAVFKFQISAVQFSASKLGHRHSPAIDGLQLSLINCEMQLKCLETLLNELLPTEDPSLAKNIWRKQKLIARYPFDRKKLVQLEEYLSRANSTLSSFIQALNLDINIRMSDKLEAFRKSIEARDINTQTSEGVAATKTCFPGIELSFQDLRNTHSTPRYLQNAELERRLCEKLADMDCSCGASNIKISKRPASRTYRFWGGLTVSRQGDVRANHRPGCIFFQRSKRNISRTSATYFGLLSFFSQCFTISLTQEYPGGPYGVSFGLQTCNIIESSPAFRFFDIGSRGFYKFFNNNKDKPSLSQTAETFIKELRLIYRSEKVSPFDVDHDGNNVAHMFLDACQGYFTFEESLKLSDTELDAICKILAYLADIGVPITASNFNQLCSLKARKLFFKHLQDRRQRLRIVALSTLPEKVLRQYGVTTSSLPDKTAVPLWRELQRTQYQQDRRVWLPDSLDPCDRTYSIPKSLFVFPSPTSCRASTRLWLRT
ncbi:hypothetical protein FDENT_479 [Fusarium denticulatum]|uniref:Fungal N-terminal domain-containing protein n=1 Tax=Fusarium denticulatum TaxID=48507 RepID=A0A8H6CWB4_9HYPO|nr:hypothetical protein FDENT_479 [Fusarium denticulatum]